MSYSFLDVDATITGPGGFVNFGNGAAVAPEGITVEPNEDKDKLDIGADGIGMHTLRADKSGKVTVRLQQTSPTNDKLNTMYLLQSASSANWGQNIIVIRNTAAGEVITCSGVAFARAPTLSYAADAAMRDWTFNAATVDRVLI